jgi:hypothetical protein
MSEADLLAEITRLCDELGVRWLHLPDSRSLGKASGASAGFPDLLLAGLHGHMFRETKGEGQWSLRTKQSEWKNLLLAGGADWGKWTEPDLKSGRIRRELEALADGGPRPGTDQAVSPDDLEAERAFFRAMAMPSLTDAQPRPRRWLKARNG